MAEVREINNGLYWVTDGTYQVMFLTTGKGVIAVDAPPNLGPKYLKAIEVKPSAREVVHHILVFIAPPSKGGSKAAKNDDVDEASGFFAAYAPGYDALVFNEGYGKVLPAGSRLKPSAGFTNTGSFIVFKISATDVFLSFNK